MNSDLKLTSVKLYPDLQENFNIDALIHKFSLQKLVNRSIHLYLTDDEFRRKIQSHNVLADSGSL